MTVSPSPEQLSELVPPSKSELISQIAPVIFEAMRWAARNAEKGSPPPWVNGNSLAEDRAREAAELLLAQAGTADALESTQAEIARLTTALNTPEVDDWAKGAALEAAHQRERWGVDHDAGKTPFDWFWLVGYLAQKAAASAVAGDTEKAKHHTISTAAALANWHLSLSGTDNRMRPGIDPVLAQNGGAGLSDPPNDTEREQAA